MMTLRQHKDPLIEIKKIMEQYIDPSQGRYFLYGSRANDTATQYSDYDIGIEAMSQKQYPIRTFFRIKAALDVLPRRIDVVDFCDIDQQFAYHAKKHIRLF